MRIYRLWWYFRRGWSTYISIPISFANTLVIIYYLLIENASAAKSLFPSFTTFAIFALAALPITTLLGWLDKRMGALRTEVALIYETNPFTVEILARLDRIEERLKWLGRQAPT